MFPVPAHLPRTGGEHLTSGSSPPGRDQDVEDRSEADTVLDLFEPLLRTKDLKSETVRAVREKLQLALQSNKDVTHELLKRNYPSISSHIRGGAQITADFKSVQAKLSILEAQIDPRNAETSFIPPVLELLQRHFTAVRAQTTSLAHIAALKELKSQAERLERLEDAVYGARGADEEVIDNVLASAEPDNESALRRSAAMKSILSRRELMRTMVIEQVTDGFKQAVSIHEASDGTSSLMVMKDVSLQRPRSARPGVSLATSQTQSPAYPLTQVYSALSRLDALTGPLSSLHTQLVERLITPLLSGMTYLDLELSDGSQSIRLVKSAQRSSNDILSDLNSTSDFVRRVVFPETTNPDLAAQRNRFLGEMHASTYRVLLDRLILPALPTSLGDLPDWLQTVQAAVDFESTTQTEGAGAIKAFHDDQAGSMWANARRRRSAEEVRRLILSGWQGWEAVEISRDKEMSVVVEVEVEEEDEPMPTDLAPTADETAKTGTVGTGSREKPIEIDVDNDDHEEEGWGFEEEMKADQPIAGPSSPSRRQNGHDEVDDGWAFDEDLTAPAPAPAPIVAPKPTREAKKLGKKVAKSRQAEDESDHDGDLSRTSSIQQPVVPASASAASTSTASPRPPSPPVRNETMDWEAWDDEKPSKQEDVKPKAKRKELREEKRTIKETFLVSKACETLLQLAESVLQDAQELAVRPPAPSFVVAPPILYTTANEVFDLYRALITSHFAAQLQNVPTLSMQAYNDSIHLSDRIRDNSAGHTAWSSDDTQRRLREAGEACFERELEKQRHSLITTLDGIEWGRGVEALKRSHSVPHQVRGDLEDLSRMFQPVLPTTTYLSVMGYLVNVTMTHVTDAILSQQDITEDESVQLTELLKMLHPLEELFVLEPGQPSSVVAHVHGWLKFCYLLELLSANLVDITYLFENGALVDFTPDELIGLLKALFADSEKREKAIERIEQGL